MEDWTQARHPVFGAKIAVAANSFRPRKQTIPWVPGGNTRLLPHAKSGKSASVLAETTTFLKLKFWSYSRRQDVK